MNNSYPINEQIKKEPANNSSFKLKGSPKKLQVNELIEYLDGYGKISQGSILHALKEINCEPENIEYEYFEVYLSATIQGEVLKAKKHWIYTFQQDLLFTRIWGFFLIKSESYMFLQKFQTINSPESALFGYPHIKEENKWIFATLDIYREKFFVLPDPLSEEKYFVKTERIQPLIQFDQYEFYHELTDAEKKTILKNAQMEEYYLKDGGVEDTFELKDYDFFERNSELSITSSDDENDDID